MPRRGMRATTQGSGPIKKVGDLKGVTSALDSVVKVLSQLDVAAALLVLQLAERLIGLHGQPPQLSAISTVIRTLDDGPQESAGTTLALRREDIEHSQANFRRAPDVDEAKHSVAKIERSTQQPAATTNGRLLKKRKLSETLDWVRARGSVSRKDVATQFNISESGAYQRLLSLAGEKLVDHYGQDAWKAI